MLPSRAKPEAEGSGAAKAPSSFKEKREADRKKTAIHDVAGWNALYFNVRIFIKDEKTNQKGHK